MRGNTGRLALLERAGNSDIESPPLLGKCRPILEVAELIRRVGPRHCTVLIEGESGVGKELVARHLHEASPRRTGPFVAVDCSNLHDSLIQSQLFGHVRGAFTGALEPSLGCLRSADGGTLFLDEIGELPLPAQVKLLRCIQERVVVPLGTVAPIAVDVRIIAATHRELWTLVRQGVFREDLYYRLQVVQITVPPLRQRREDIPLLAEYFLDLLARRYDEPPKRFLTAALDVLTAHPWPGNVRELANAVEHAFVFCPGQHIHVEHLPQRVRRPDPTCPAARFEAILPLAAAERCLIENALRATGGNRARAARLLQMERRRFGRKLRRYGLSEYPTPCNPAS